MALKIEMLRCFCSVARTGTLAQAASRLGRTQSAISMTLKQLEEHLGRRLFEGERKNRLTPFGEEVFELAQTELRRFDDTVLAIETSAASPRGMIRIATVPSVAGLVFPAAIETMTRRNPGLKIELRDTDTPQVIDAMVQGKIDLGVVSGLHSLNGIRQTLLFEDRFGLICARDHPLARQKPDPTIAQIAEAGFANNTLCDMIETPDFRAAVGETRVMIHNTLSLIAMVRSGAWVTVLPGTVAQILPSELVFRPVAGIEDRRPVFLCLRENAHFRPMIDELAQLLTGADWDSLQGSGQP